MQLDKKQTAGGSKFTLHVPANALDRETEITMIGQGEGSVVGGYTGSGTENYTLTLLEPCS